LETYTAIPSFFPCFKMTVEVIFLNAVKYHLRFPLDVRHFVPSVSFTIWETKRNHRGLSPASRKNHVVVSHKLCGFQGCVGVCVIVMKEPVVVMPKFGLFVAHFLASLSRHSKSQS
jgi:hypothetical protein